MRLYMGYRIIIKYFNVLDITCNKRNKIKRNRKKFLAIVESVDFKNVFVFTEAENSWTSILGIFDNFSYCSFYMFHFYITLSTISVYFLQVKCSFFESFNFIDEG